MNCGTCKWWGKNVPIYPGARAREDQTGEYRQCGRLVHDSDNWAEGSDYATPVEGRDWLTPELKAAMVAERDLVLSQPAVLKDGSGYFAALKSRADFGCVLYEPREDPK